MKKIITSVALMLTATISNAQTTATNWTATDCNGLSHTLFNELDSGKVIVLVWVMPCSSCINPSKTAYNVVQTFATSFPGKVRYYLSDDLGDASCATLTSWITSNSIGSVSNMKVFSNSGNVIDENNFGGPGMPQIVVMGGSSHSIFFNKRNSAANDSTGIKDAITSAISATGINNVSADASFTVSPNPANDHFAITHNKAILKLTVTSANGQTIIDSNYPTGKKDPEIDLSQLANGLYFIKITDTDNRTGIQKAIKQ